MKPKRKRTSPWCKEGDWFAVPLRSGGYALCVIARITDKYGALGYFFGPRYNSLPRTQDIVGKAKDSALVVRWFSTLGIKEGVWQKVGESRDWDRTHWPVPVFARIDVLSKDCAWAVYYDEYGDVVQEERIPVETAQLLPADGLSGYGAAEILITRAIEKLDKEAAGTKSSPEAT